MPCPASCLPTLLAVVVAGTWARFLLEHLRTKSAAQQHQLAATAAADQAFATFKLPAAGMQKMWLV
jgi:hypothetical protein